MIEKKMQANDPGHEKPEPLTIFRRPKNGFHTRSSRKLTQMFFLINWLLIKKNAQN
jgi:hypothetical protein